MARTGGKRPPPRRHRHDGGGLCSCSESRGLHIATAYGIGAGSWCTQCETECEGGAGWCSCCLSSGWSANGPTYRKGPHFQRGGGATFCGLCEVDCDILSEAGGDCECCQWMDSELGKGGKRPHRAIVQLSE